MRDRYAEFQAKKAGVCIIGMGTVPEAAAFRDRLEIPFPMLVDPKQVTYRTLQMGQARATSLTNPKMLISGAKSLIKGRGISRPRQDPFQLGGAAVIRVGGEISYMHQAESFSDIASSDELLDAL